MNANQTVFVDSRTEQFHAVLNCPHAKTATHWCSATEAHRSRLRACQQCARTLALGLARTHGSIPSGARKGLGTPKLNPVPGASESDQSGDDAEAALSYGAPESLKVRDSQTDRRRTEVRPRMGKILPNSWAAPKTTTATGVAEIRCTTSRPLLG